MDSSQQINLLQMIISILVSVLGSSGVWMIVLKRMERRDCKTNLLLALAHDRIIYLCLKFIESGELTQDEHENMSFLYSAYTELGGNGTARRLMEQVNSLPIRSIRRKDTGELKNVVK